MPENYTPNQTGAIACLLAINVWGFTSYVVAPFVSYIIPWFFLIFMIIGWVLLLLYIKLSKYAFMIGIFITIVGMIYIPITPNLLGGAKWYEFTRGLYDFSVVLYYLVGLVHIYFSYKSYREVMA